MAASILPSFPTYFDADGSPLEEGYIYIGTSGLDPVGNPITVYWDAALTIPAAQPVRTLNGYPSLAGTPAILYAPTSMFSQTVKTKSGVTVYTALTNPVTDALGSMATQNANAVAITGGTITGLSSPLPVASGGTGGATQSAARTGLGLGSMAVQGAGAVAVTGGTIDGTAIGGATPAAGSFTDLIGNALLSSETTGTLTVASRNRIILCSGGITLPANVFEPRNILVADGNGTTRTFTRGSGLAMYLNGTDVATATLAAQGLGGVYFRGGTVCILSGAFT